MENEVDAYTKLCEVGDVLFKVSKNKISRIVITKIDACPHYVYYDDQRNMYFNRNIVKSCFKTIEEAEKELNKQDLIRKKKTELKKYEKQLNQEYGIDDHYIIK